MKTHTYLFHLIGGQTLRVPNVVFLQLMRGTDDRWSGYKIEWAEGKKPPFFSIVLADISAVTTENM